LLFALQRGTVHSTGRAIVVVHTGAYARRAGTVARAFHTIVIDVACTTAVCAAVARVAGAMAESPQCRCGGLIKVADYTRRLAVSTTEPNSAGIAGNTVPETGLAVKITQAHTGGGAGTMAIAGGLGTTWAL